MAGEDRRTHGAEGEIAECNWLEIKSDRMERRCRKKMRGIMGKLLLLPSFLSSVIRHQSTPSLRIPSSLRQFHSPVSACVTQSSAQIWLEASNLHYVLLSWPCGPHWQLFVEL